MKVYHASTGIVEKPDVVHSRKYLDFGQGFYVTALCEQACKYAKRFLKLEAEAYINEYELADDWRENCNVKVFDRYDENWLDFVSANRNGDKVETYDAVEGGIANDKVFETVDLFIGGLIGRSEALQRLAFEKPNHQICFLAQHVMEENLKYIKAKKITK